MKIIIIKETLKYKVGDILDIKINNLIKEGVNYNSDFISKSNYIILKEELTPEDIKKIEQIFDKKIIKLFWRLYTKAKIIL